jgi:hypothetical protein
MTTLNPSIHSRMSVNWVRISFQFIGVVLYKVSQHPKCNWTSHLLILRFHPVSLLLMPLFADWYTLNTDNIICVYKSNCTLVHAPICFGSYDPSSGRISSRSYHASYTASLHTVVLNRTQQTQEPQGKSSTTFYFIAIRLYKTDTLIRLTCPLQSAICYQTPTTHANHRWTAWCNLN